MTPSDVTSRYRHQLAKTTIDSIVFDESSRVKPSESVRNLGSWFGAQMRMYECKYRQNL